MKKMFFLLPVLVLGIFLAYQTFLKEILKEEFGRPYTWAPNYTEGGAQLPSFKEICGLLYNFNVSFESGQDCIDFVKKSSEILFSLSRVPKGNLSLYLGSGCKDISCFADVWEYPYRFKVLKNGTVILCRWFAFTVPLPKLGNCEKILEGNTKIGTITECMNLFDENKDKIFSKANVSGNIISIEPLNGVLDAICSPTIRTKIVKIVKEPLCWRSGNTTVCRRDVNATCIYNCEKQKTFEECMVECGAYEEKKEVRYGLYEFGIDEEGNIYLCKSLTSIG